jgi:hypothetical protein
MHELAGGLDALRGARWQSRQNPMLMGFIWVTTSISFTLPWHSTQPMPRFTWIEWSK